MEISVKEFEKRYKEGQYSLEQLKNIKYALDHSAIVGITDRQGRIVYVNKHFCEITKYKEEELLGKDHRILNSGYHPKSFFKEMWSTIGKGEIWHGEVCNRAKDGSLYWVQTTIVPILDENSRPYQYISIRIDITEQKNIKRIRHMAYHDELTGLPNRRMLNMVLPEEIAKCNEEKKKMALIFMDIDRFKNINDSFGHSIGDLFLAEVAERLLSLEITDKKIFRLSGDEFIILVHNTSHGDDLKKIVNSIIELFDKSFTIEGYEFFVNISVGISIYPDSSSDGESLIRHANRAMYFAKDIPGNNCITYDSSMDTDYEKILLLDTKLRQAIENDSLQLYYQPKINPQTEKISGAEALIRWFDDDLGYIPPNEFIPIAEDRGLINTIGDWTLRTAANQVKEWEKELGFSLSVAVNISPTHFNEATFVENVRQIIKETAIDPHYLEIEITENSMLDYTEELINKLAELKNIGIKISMDDFGTGYSSLSYLKKFPIDALKIDQSFIRDLLTEKKSVAFIAEIISLAHALKLDVIAEGVEEKEQLEILKEHNCDLIQGYYYSRPLPAADFVKDLKEFF